MTAMSLDMTRLYIVWGCVVVGREDEEQEEDKGKGRGTRIRKDKEMVRRR